MTAINATWAFALTLGVFTCVFMAAALVIGSFLDRHNPQFRKEDILVAVQFIVLFAAVLAGAALVAQRNADVVQGSKSETKTLIIEHGPLEID